MGAVRVVCRLVVIVAVSAGGASTLADHVDIYILTGQSNSLGTTELEVTDFGPGSHPADAQIDFFWSNVSTASSDPNNIILYGDSGGSLSTLQVQQGDGGANPVFWGPEFGMARKLFDAGNSRVAVVKLSRGGGGNGFWLPTTGHMHNHLLKQIDAALSAVGNAGYAFEVKGFIYLQGESNNGPEAAAADARLRTLIEGVQTHINAKHSNAAANMYSVIGEIAASSSNVDRVTTTNLQRALAAGNSRVGFIETRDQILKGDGLHFGRDAKLEIGRRFADAFISQDWVESPKLIAGYSARVGNANAVPHPVAQGFSEAGSLFAGVTLSPVNDGGTPAWRIANNSRSANPGYRQALIGPQFKRMFDDGWTFKATVKVLAGGGQAFWSLTQDNDPGWGLTAARHAIGFELNRVNGNELEVSLWTNQSLINLGAGSADQFHTIELRGAVGSSLYDFYIDGQLRAAGNNLLGGAGLVGSDNMLLFRSGAGAGREVYWNEVALTVVPEPESHCLLALTGTILLGLQLACKIRLGSKPRRQFSQRQHGAIAASGHSGKRGGVFER